MTQDVEPGRVSRGDVAAAAPPRVGSVSAGPAHGFSKPVVDEIRLLPGLGVEGDAHCGRTVQHRSRVRRDPTRPNLRQVHLLAAELLDELAADGHRVAPGDLGENVLTEGVDLLGLPTGTVLRLGDEAAVEVTGLRNPCHQIDDFRAGLLRRVLWRGDDGSVVRRAGVMAVVLAGGPVRVGDPVEVRRPAGAHVPLAPV